MKYLDCDGRSGRSGNRHRAPGQQLEHLVGAQPRRDDQDIGLDRPGGRGRDPAPPRPGDGLRPGVLGHRDAAGPQAFAQHPGHRGQVGEPGVHVQPPAVGVELGEPLRQLGPGEDLAAQLQLLQDRVALHRVGLVQVRRDAVLDQVEAAAVDQQPLAGRPLELPPQLPRLEGQPGVGRVPVVVAHRPGQAERRGRRIAHPGPLQHGHGVGQRRGVVRRHESHDSAADDRQPPGHRHAPSLLAGRYRTAYAAGHSQNAVPRPRRRLTGRKSPTYIVLP